MRSGSFKKGHPKRGGRKGGTPNLISADYKRAIIEAAYRVGEDGNGKDGVLGYLSWVGKHHPTISYTVLLVSLLPFEEAEGYDPGARLTAKEINQSSRDYIGLDN